MFVKQPYFISYEFGLHGYLGTMLNLMPIEAR